MNRRGFFSECSWTIMRWCPLLGLFGFRFCRYTFDNGMYLGWIEWCGKLVAFVPK